MTRKNKKKPVAPQKGPTNGAAAQENPPTSKPTPTSTNPEGKNNKAKVATKKAVAERQDDGNGSTREITATIPNEETEKRSRHSDEWSDDREVPRLCISCHLLEEMALEVLAFHQLRVRTMEFRVDPEALAEYRRICVEIGNCCGGGALRSYLRHHGDSYDEDDYYTTSSSSATGVFWKNKEPVVKIRENGGHNEDVKDRVGDEGQKETPLSK
jgi:hypothetical protein